MEGSRHEKAALVLAAYVIGFTTAFILYANITTNTEDTFISISSATPAAVIEAELPPVDAVADEVVVTEPEVVAGTKVSYEDGKLFVKTGTESTLLSFNPENSDLKADTATLSQGFHYSTPVYTVSADGAYVFFCEQQDVTTTACMGYVYDLNSQTIHQVTKNGSPVLVSENSAKNAVWGTNGLTVGTNSSVSLAAPWLLGQ